MSPRIYPKNPWGRPMPRRTALANAAKSRMRSAIEHVFARPKPPVGLIARTIGVTQATTMIGLAKVTDNMQRLVLPGRKAAPAWMKTPGEAV